MTPCLALSAVSRPRSPNSEWWKFDSPNQRSTRGTARTSSAARSAAARVSARAASWSNVALAICSRVLTTMTVGFARAAIDSGRAPNRYGSPSAPNGWAEAPITTRSAFSASRRIAARRFGASRRSASPSALRCCFMNAASACSAWARTVAVIPAGRGGGLRPWPHASGDRVGEADRSSACGPPRTGTRIRRIDVAPRCLTTAMSHGDRATSSIVGENTAGPCPLRRSAPCRPSRRSRRSDSCSPDASMMPSAARRPMRTIG